MCFIYFSGKSVWGRAGSAVNLGVRWFTSHERFNCQVTATKRIARGGIARIVRIPNTEQLNFQ